MCAYSLLRTAIDISTAALAAFTAFATAILAVSNPLATALTTTLTVTSSSYTSNRASASSSGGDAGRRLRSWGPVCTLCNRRKAGMALIQRPHRRVPHGTSSHRRARNRC